MSTQAATLGKTGRYADLKRRAVFLLLALVVYRIGTHIPVPLINPDQFRQAFESQQGGILGLLNMFSGGALSRFSVLSIGIMPYISASIIMQMLTYVLPSLESLRKEGESGRRKVTQYTRYATVGVATIQSYMAIKAIESVPNLVIQPGFTFEFIGVVSLVTGCLFLMWLGEQITERGLGNGISIIIFSGIAAGLPSALGRMFELVRTGALAYLAFFAIVLLVMAVTAFVVFVERGQRRILVNYAKRQVGNRVYGGQSSYLPLKLNMSGVIPPIFARHDRQLVLLGRCDALDPRPGGGAATRPAAVPVAVREPDHLLLLLLYGPGFQQQGAGGQPEEKRRFRSRHPAGRADSPPRRQDPAAADADRRDLHHARVPGAGIPVPALERSVLLWRDLPADRGGGNDGFHGSGAGLPDDAPVRIAAEEGELPRTRRRGADAIADGEG